MDRQEIYQGITTCGNMDYKSLISLLDAVYFANKADRKLLRENSGINGRLAKYDWVYFVNTVEFLDDKKVTKEIALHWITTQNKFTQTQLIELLESIRFEDSSLPTYLMDGGFYLTDN